MGRPRKPTALKLVTGTLRKHRENASEPVVAGDWPDAPAWLSAGAATIFQDTCGRMAKMGTVSSEFSDAIAAYASCEQEVIELTAVIEDLGRTYQTTTATGDTMFRPRPEVAMRNNAMRRATVLRADLGLGPVSKSRVSAKPPDESNPFKDL